MPKLSKVVIPCFSIACSFIQQTLDCQAENIKVVISSCIHLLNQVCLFNEQLFCTKYWDLEQHIQGLSSFRSYIPLEGRQNLTKSTNRWTRSFQPVIMQWRISGRVKGEQMTRADVAVGDATFRRGLGGASLYWWHGSWDMHEKQAALWHSRGVCKLEEATGSKAQDRKAFGGCQEQRCVPQKLG